VMVEAVAASEVRKRLNATRRETEAEGIDDRLLQRTASAFVAGRPYPR
jgi:hypothetical protein